MRAEWPSALLQCLLLVLFARGWIDLLEFLYYRERARACRHLATEGLNLIRFALERGLHLRQASPR